MYTHPSKLDFRYPEYGATPGQARARRDCQEGKYCIHNLLTHLTSMLAVRRLARLSTTLPSTRRPLLSSPTAFRLTTPPGHRPVSTMETIMSKEAAPGKINLTDQAKLCVQPVWLKTFPRSCRPLCMI